MTCKKETKFGKDALTEKDKKIVGHLTRSFNIYRDKPLVRYIMTLQPKGGTISYPEFRSWAENKLGSSFADLTVTDAVFIESEATKLLNRSKEKIFADNSKVKEFFIKAMTLPYDLYAMHGLGEVHETATFIDQTRDSRKADFGSKILGLRSTIQNLVGESITVGEKQIRGLNENIELANSRYMSLRENKKSGGTATDAQISAAKDELSVARQQHRNKTHHSSSEAGESAKALRLVAEFLNGDLGSIKDGSGKRKLAARLEGSVDHGTVTDVVNKAQAISEQFSKLMADSTNKFQKSLQYELEAKMSKEDAAKMSKEIISFDALEEYYPNRNLVSLYQRVDGMMRAREIVSSGGKDIVGKINDLAKLQQTSHAKRRKGSNGMIDQNMIKVLEVYGNEVIDHAHAAEMNHMATSFIRGLMTLDNVRAVKGKPMSDEALYTESVKKLMMGHMSQIFDRKMGAIGDDAIRVMTSFQVFAKLANVSTTVNNALGGALQTVSSQGVQNISKLEELGRTHEVVIQESLKSVATDFVVANLMDPGYNIANNKNLRKALTAEDFADAETIIDLQTRGVLAKARNIITTTSDKGLDVLGWKKTENFNRKKTFHLAAGGAAEHATTKLRDQVYDGKVSDFLIRSYGLDKAKALRSRKSGKEFLQDKEDTYTELRNNYILRRGFRAIAQSQFQYGESARNGADLNPRTSWATMFQHYPRSLGSTVMWAMYDVKNIYDIGGIHALKGEITERKLGRRPDDGKASKLREKLAINHSLQHVITLGGVALLTELLKQGTGFAFFNALGHPFTDMAADLYDYFVDDEPHSRKDATHQFLYGRKQPIRRLMGPIASDALDLASGPARDFLTSVDAFSMALLDEGIRNGSVAQHLSDALGMAGARTAGPQYTPAESKAQRSAMESVSQEALHQFAMYDKTQALVNAAIAKNPYEFGIQSLRMVGIRPDWKVIKKGEDSLPNI